MKAADPVVKWQPGRRGGAYRKLLLLRGARWDLYLIDYQPGVGIPEHSDSLPGRRHVRANLALLKGGSRFYSDASIMRLGRLVVFWSDRPHRVIAGTGRRVVLSLGLALAEQR